MLLAQLSTSSAAPSDPTADQVTHTTEPGALARDPVSPPPKLSISKRASSGPDAAQAYLRKIGMKPVAVSDVGLWTSEDGTPIGLAIRVSVVPGTIPGDAPSLEPARRSCEQESDSTDKCAGLFQPTPNEPYRIAPGRRLREEVTGDLVVLVDQRTKADTIASVEPVPTRA